MAIENLHNFLHDFFIANQCTIKENKDGILAIKLTDKMDEYIMNRPFYWQYIKKIGQKGDPGSITFLTDPRLEEKEAEIIHFGSPRLQQIFRLVKDQGKSVRLYQQLAVQQQTALIPWLILNIKISYIGKQKREEIKSIGIHMINGAMLDNIMDTINQISWHNTIPDYCYNLSPLIRLKNSYQRVIHYLEKDLLEKQHDWALESWKFMQEEKKLLDYFYQSDAADQLVHFEKESAAIEDLYQPRITIDIINGGVFHISQSTSSSILEGNV
ncbi:YqhG family protein [Paraliobacillus sediminis]|uniref:YqhG family protein n=1 Tax=Paraliobacillus sediminis TaxID=1885916 RepID=UPI0013C2F07B|nr:YqhG family protein [Paraliobacillus sediminis]